MCCCAVHFVVLDVQAPYRSRSAPREEAAARRHVDRMCRSPSRVRASRDSILSQQQQQRLVSAPWQLQQEEDFIADRRVRMSREAHVA